MNARLLIAAVVVSATYCTHTYARKTHVDATDPFIGTFKLLNVGNRLGPGGRYIYSTLVHERLGEWVRQAVTFSDAAGASVTFTYKMREDGRDYVGEDSRNTMARVCIGARHCHEVEKRPDGSVVANYDITLSEDGTTLTIKRDQMDRAHPAIVKSTRTEVYHRQR